jgi:hypothetical protein
MTHPRFRPEDPVQELSKIRKLLTSLEHFVLLQTGQPSVSSPEADGALPDTPGLLTLPPSGGKAGAVGALPDTPGPGTRGRQSGGLYNGATSMLTILIDVSRTLFTNNGALAEVLTLRTRTSCWILPRRRLRRPRSPHHSTTIQPCLVRCRRWRRSTTY